MHILNRPAKYTSVTGLSQSPAPTQDVQVHGHIYSVVGLILLSLAVLLTTFADRLTAFALGSGVLLNAPPDRPGLNVFAVFGPLIALALPMSFLNSLFWRDGRIWLVLQLLLRSLMATTLCFPSIKLCLSNYSPHLTALLIASIFLGSQMTLASVLTLLRQCTIRPLPYLAALGSSFFMAQGLAVNLAAAVTTTASDNLLFDPVDGLKVVSACAYAAASWLFIVSFDKLNQAKVREDFNRQALAQLTPAAEREQIREREQAREQEQEKQHQDWWQLCRYLAATAILFLPLFAPLFASLLFALQGQQAGLLPMSQLCGNLSFACAFGAIFSIFLNRLARKRTILQVVALAALILFSSGAICRHYSLSYFSLTAMAALAGLLAPDWYHHLFTHVSEKGMQRFLAGKDTLLIAAYCLISVPLAGSLATVSSLYFLKELNLVGAVLSMLAILTAPLMLSVLGQSEK